MLRDQGSTYPTRPPHQSTTRAPNGCKFPDRHGFWGYIQTSPRAFWDPMATSPFSEASYCKVLVPRPTHKRGRQSVAHDREPVERAAFRGSDGLEPPKSVTVSKFRGSITRLLVSLSTPRGDGLPPLHARLASGYWSQLCRAGFQPAGFLRKVSEHQYSSSSPELSWRELCFGAFLSLPTFSLRLHWPLATILSPLATISRRPPGPAGSGRAQTLPRWYCLPPTAELRKIEWA